MSTFILGRFTAVVLAGLSIMALFTGDYFFSTAILFGLFGRALNLVAVNANNGRMPVYCKREEMKIWVYLYPYHFVANKDTPKLMFGDIIDTRFLGIWSIGDLFLFLGYGLSLIYFFSLVTAQF